MNKTNKKSLKEYKKIIISSSPKKQKYNVKDNILKISEINKLSSSSYKIIEKEIILTKSKIISNKYHRRIKSNSSQYMDNIDIFDNNFRINSSTNKASFIKENNKNEHKEIDNKINNKYLVSRNKKLKFNNLLNNSSSLKDLKNTFNFSNYNINLSYEKLSKKTNKNNIKNKINFGNNKSTFYIGNSTNLEETRNTTSINNNLNNNIVNKKFNKEENKNKELKQYLIINDKQKKRKLNSMDNHLKNNNNYNNNKINKVKNNPKKNLHSFIFRNNNIEKKNEKNYLNSPKKTLKNNEKINNLTIKTSFFESFYDSRPLSFMNSQKEIKRKLYYPKIQKKYFHNSISKNVSSNKDKQKSKILSLPKYKKRYNNSQEKINNLKTYENDKIPQFQSVEIIHFKFVELIQRKNEFFEKKD